MLYVHSCLYDKPISNTPSTSTCLNIIPVEGNPKVVGMEAGERNNLVTAVVCITGERGKGLDSRLQQ